MAGNFRGAEVMRRFIGRIPEARLRAAEIVFERSQFECPVRTGELKASGKIVDMPDQDRTEIVYTAPHAGFVHGGTVNRLADPFLSRAEMGTRSEVAAVMRDIFGK